MAALCSVLHGDELTDRSHTEQPQSASHMGGYSSLDFNTSNCGPKFPKVTKGLSVVFYLTKLDIEIGIIRAVYDKIAALQTLLK